MTRHFTLFNAKATSLLICILSMIVRTLSTIEPGFFQFYYANVSHSRSDLIVRGYQQYAGLT